MGKKLFVGKLPFAATDHDLNEIFSQVGKVVSAKVIMDRETGRSKGFGFVEFSTDEEAANAISQFNGADYGGFAMVVNEATIRALEAPESQGQPASLYTDSVYVIRGITQWIWGWRKNGWKTADGKDVTNQELWKRLSAALATRDKSAKVDWHYVRGHSGIPGNERVDQIAVAFSKGQSIRLFRGSLLDYSVAIHDIPADTSLPEMRARTQEKARPAGYLSLVGATAMRHSDWASCERRVKGVSGAKFKKVMSADEEAQVLRSWGVDPAALCCKKS